MHTSMPMDDGRPPMPGMTQGPGGAPGMIHTEVFLSGDTLEVELVGGPGFSETDDPMAGVVMRQGAGFAAPFDVLNDKFFNGQYGWLPSSQPGNELQSLPIELVIGVELIGIDTDASGTLETYDGGNGMQLRPTDANGDLLPTLHTMQPLFTQIGDVWLWEDFVMQHNWYAATRPGDYRVTYEVFVSDRSGVRDLAYGSDTISLDFTVVPEPAALLSGAGISLAMLRRREARA
ncbi:MAG: hypothetical protein AAGE65_14840 [Planctomycetota bacterium]